MAKQLYCILIVGVLFASHVSGKMFLKKFTKADFIENPLIPFHVSSPEDYNEIIEINNVSDVVSHGWTMQDRLFRVEPFTKYKFEFYTYSKDLRPSDQISFKVMIWDIKPITIQQYEYKFPISDDSQQWKKQYVEFVTISNADRFVLELTSTAKIFGKAAIKGMKLWQISENHAHSPVEVPLKLISGETDIPEDAKYIRAEFSTAAEKIENCKSLNFEFNKNRKILSSEKIIFTRYNGIQEQWSGIAMDWVKCDSKCYQSYERQFCKISGTHSGIVQTKHLFKVPSKSSRLKIYTTDALECSELKVCAIKKYLFSDAMSEAMKRTLYIGD